MAEEFVRVDVFNARMDRMEALMEKTLIEIKADNDKLRSEVNTAIGDLRSEMNTAIGGLRNEMNTAIGNLRNEMNTAIGDMNTAIGGLRNDMNTAIGDLRNETNTAIVGLRSDIRVLDTRLNGLETTVYWGFAIIAFILAFSAFVPSVTEFFRGLRRPSVTPEDVRRIVGEMIEQARLGTMPATASQSPRTFA